VITRRQFLSISGSPLFASLVRPVETVAADVTSDKFAALLNVLRERTHLPAVAAVIANRSEIVAKGVAGRKRSDRPDPVLPNAHWQLGSITKTFTATLAAILVEKGKLEWDTKLVDIYPKLSRVMAANVGQITIRLLVEHRSGMGTDAFPWEGAPEFNQPGLTLSQRRQRSVPLALRAPLDFQPGKRFQYSNRAYNLLGAVLERVAGRPWEDLIVNEIARPLGLGSVVFGEPALADPNGEPWPHVLENHHWKPVAPVPPTMYGYHVCNPAGGISLTLPGVARWMQAHLTGELTSNVLSTEMMKTIHSTREDGGVPAIFIDTKSPALGRSLAHNGSNNRNYANLMILPDRGVGIFFACNAVPPENAPSNWLIWNTLVASALPGRWPRPALRPPRPNSQGVIEGEALQVVKLTGGSIDFQNFKQLSRQFQIWWSGAKDGDRLALRFQLPQGRKYSLEGVFARNRDFGGVTIRVGNLERSLNFHSPSLGWGKVSLGECSLDAGAQNMTVIAKGSAGQNGIACHLGLDTLSLRAVD
jgi:CubicO group peptidase (beta-lactamase class C family)